MREVAYREKMMNPQHPSTRKKIVLAPPPSTSSIPPSIYSIEINEDEEVEWHWLDLPDGNRVVTNYKIKPNNNKTID